MSTIVIEPPTMDPLDVARDMAGKGYDPGLIVHYLALEKRLDPTLGMDEWEKANYLVDLAIAEVQAHIAHLVQHPPVVTV